MHLPGLTRLSRLGWLPLAAALCTCGGPGDPIVLGAAGPWHLQYAMMSKRGIDLAVEEVNRGGGIGGRPLRVEFRNDSADASHGVQIASDFVADRRVAAVLGHVNSGSMVAAARIYHGELAAVSPTAASPELSGISPWVFRLISNDSVFGVLLARRASGLGRRAAVLYDNNSFGRGGAYAFRRNFAGRIVSADPIWPGDLDLAPFVSYYRQHGVDLVFVAGVTPSGRALLQEARRQGYRGAILGTDSWAPLAGERRDAEGVYIAMRFSVLEPRPEVAAFARTFRARYGDQAPDGFAAFAYDATHLLARALREKGADRAGVRDYLAALERTGPYPGVTGPVRFTPGGDPASSRFVLLRVRGGRLTLVR